VGKRLKESRGTILLSFSALSAVVPGFYYETDEGEQMKIRKAIEVAGALIVIALGLALYAWGTWLWIVGAE
jgi:hypothetical protein